MAGFLARYLAKNGELFGNLSPVRFCSHAICHLIRQTMPNNVPSHTQEAMSVRINLFWMRSKRRTSLCKIALWLLHGSQGMKANSWHQTQ